MKLKYCVLAMLLPLLKVTALPLQPLTVGATVPDVTLTLVNYNKPAAKLSAFKGKPVILDFWGTRCGACIHHFADLDALLQQFGDKICILAVSSKPTGDNSQAIQAFIKGYKQRIRGGFSFPCAVNDAVLYKLFPHIAIPHYVWIGSDGKFIAITDGDEINAANISRLLTTGSITFRHKANDMLYDLLQPPYIHLNNEDSSKVFVRSLLTGYIDGLNHAVGFDGDAATNQVTKFFAINASPFELFKHACLLNEIVPRSRVIINVPNADDFMLLGNRDTSKFTKTYCYELIMPPSGYNAFQTRMQQDLYAYFNVKAATEARNAKCLVLTVADSTLLDTAKGEAGNSFSDKINGERLMTNQPPGVLVEKLDDILPIPVIDETNLNRNINLHLPAQLTDVDALKTALQAQGLQLKEAYRMIDFFVLTADNNPQTN